MEQIVYITLLISAIIVLAIIGGRTGDEKIKQFQTEAVALNFAEYNSTNGVWQWKAVTNKP